MDFARRIVASAVDIFRSLTPGTRVLGGAMAALIVVALAALLRSDREPLDVLLMGGAPLPESQLTQMELAFAKRGLSDYRIDDGRVSVPLAKQADYMAALADGGALPLNFGEHMSKALQRGGWLGVPQAEREMMLKLGLQQELSAIIGVMKGIESAAVLFDVHTSGGLHPKESATASVNVKTVGQHPLEDEQVDAIRYFISGAIRGLTPDKVTVLDATSGRVFHSGIAAHVISGGEEQYLKAKLRFEKMLQTKIQNALQYLPGAVVTVNVELAPDGAAKPSASDLTVQGLPSAGQAGAMTGAAVEAAAQGNHTDPQLSEPPGRLYEHSGLVPQLASVSVAVPSTYYAEVWRERNAMSPGNAPSAEELAAIELEEKTKIEQHVAQLLPNGAARNDLGSCSSVTVTTFQSVAAADSPPLLRAQAVFWLSKHGGTAAMSGLGLLSLLLLWFFASRQASNNAIPAMGIAAIQPELSSADQLGPQPMSDRRDRAGSSTELQQELLKVVRDDPAAAAGILRRWIGQAS